MSLTPVRLITSSGLGAPTRSGADAGARQFVFGYGSLAAAPGCALSRRFAPEGFVADLSGFDRAWGVAMDNRRDLPGYKYYTLPDGRRPAADVAFLDLRVTRVSDRAVNGVCLAADESELAALDLRERNYDRIDVSDRIDARGARVWAYAGTRAARERLARGRRTGAAMIDAGYLATVKRAFAGFGESEFEACGRSLEPGELPVHELTRHDLP